MMYSAVRLCPDGGVIRHEETQEVANELLGDFESMDEAITQACQSLNCTHLHNGVISKGQFKGGYLIVTTQELEAV
ncbi:hypothetical protein L3Q72_19825 [Vibrio sp. JC009]|uniref:hypothetical protein n=1 Tax=Vibrio sp. JC009 TaxID=2912314 RepID=UPI0023B0A3B4|nr:hypothetical protein [Vibrio sp. JC009]WED23491.1 hypothetical protein L3Q72_19825 [Vibrio sp. JC009]